MVIFTSSLICVYFNSLAFVVSKSFPNVFHEVRSLTQMTGYNQEFCFWLTANGFSFSFFFLDNMSLLEDL